MLQDYRLIRDALEQGKDAMQGNWEQIGPLLVNKGGVEISSKKWVVIGRYCLIGWNVTITDTDYHGIGYNPPKDIPTTLEEGVWVGCNSIILKGITGGRGAGVSPGRVVNKNVPPYTIVGGNPAKVIKEIEPFEGKHGQIYEYKWWDPSFVPKEKPA